MRFVQYKFINLFTISIRHTLITNRNVFHQIASLKVNNPQWIDQLVMQYASIYCPTLNVFQIVLHVSQQNGFLLSEMFVSFR